MTNLSPPTATELQSMFQLKYTQFGELGSGPRLRFKFGYFNPDDVYEALVEKLVSADSAWMDVGCGRALFPSNAPLARRLSKRCRRLVGVEPDSTIQENPYVHEKIQCTIEEYTGRGEFDLVTMRMVAEHVEHPDRVAAQLAGLVQPGGLVVVYTVNRFSPVPVITALAPFKLHHPVKRFLWRTESRDSFPTCFRMNTRRRLRDLFECHGFSEVLFMRLDDCRTFSRFTLLMVGELLLWSAFRAVGVPYPENCLLGVYQLGSTQESACSFQ